MTQTADRVVVAIEGRRAAFLEAIRSATRSVRLSMFRCNDFQIMDALGEALGRGVAVELLLTRRAKGWEGKIRNIGLYLESMGARVYRYAPKKVKYHAKYLLVDDRAAIVASLNLTRKSFEKTADFMVGTEDPDVVESLSRLFQHDATAPYSAAPEGLSPRLIVGPETAREGCRKLMEGARRILRIVDHRVTDAEMLALLERRQSEGVRVEIYGRGALASHKSHGKMVIVDDATAAVGSISLSTPSLDGRREISIVTEDEECVTRLLSFLERYGTASPLQRFDVADHEEKDDDEAEE
jgi:phosphatidylserine/phosphatidylglycerophosphate/cardiolipin synthase-like enzyme